MLNKNIWVLCLGIHILKQLDFKKNLYINCVSQHLLRVAVFHTLLWKSLCNFSNFTLSQLSPPVSFSFSLLTLNFHLHTVYSSKLFFSPSLPLLNSLSIYLHIASIVSLSFLLSSFLSFMSFHTSALSSPGVKSSWRRKTSVAGRMRTIIEKCLRHHIWVSGCVLWMHVCVCVSCVSPG